MMQVNECQAGSLGGEYEDDFKSMQNSAALVTSSLSDSASTQLHPMGLGRTCIVFAADESYGMPLATAIRSLIEANEKISEVEIYVLSNGISNRTQARVAESFAGFAMRLHWLPVDLTTYSDFRTLHYASKMTFARLQIPDLLPAHIERALYLDADVLILRDITELLLTDLGAAPLGAVLDSMDRERPLVDHRPAGVPAVTRYFNAGMLLVDLKNWRAAQVSERAFRFLEANPQTPYADQDALNVACDEVWIELDERWNFQRSRDLPAFRSASPSAPAILHFVTADKPWYPNTRNRNAALYDEVRSRTGFARNGMTRSRDHLLRALSKLKRSIKTNSGLVRASSVSR